MPLQPKKVVLPLISFLFILATFLNTPTSFVYAEEGHISGDVIVIDGITYKKGKSAFSKLSPSKEDGDNYDTSKIETPAPEFKESGSGLSSNRKIRYCPATTLRDCKTIEIAKVDSIGRESVYGDSVNGSRIWLDTLVNGGNYFSPFTDVMEGYVEQSPLPAKTPEATPERDFSLFGLLSKKLKAIPTKVLEPFGITIPQKYRDAVWSIKRVVEDLKIQAETLDNLKEEVPEKPKELAKTRLFKTSVPNINIRSKSNTKGNVLKVIPEIKTEIRVVGVAVTGEYIDVYKTNRWYPVECKDCKEENGNDVKQGYILATLLHPDFIEFDGRGMNCNGKHQINGGSLDRTVLHGTYGSSVSSALNGFRKDSCIGAHFYLGRNGKVVQSATADRLIWHAGYGGLKSRKELSKYSTKSSFTSVGIEIVNWGIIKNQNDPKTPDIDTVFPDYWNTWKEGLYWGGFPAGIDSKKWQFYTDDQYMALDELISYIEESTGIPYRVTKYKKDGDTNNDIAYYYHPISPSDTKKSSSSFEENKRAYRRQTSVIANYLNNLFSFRGVVDHHAHAGKWDTGPAFDICNKHLNFEKLKDFCKL